ncbi:MAG: N-acetylmuramic acid 6-phosphate etherase, partial [Saprospiraceae bacterium]
MDKITERASRHRRLEQKSVRELLEGINAEDRSVADAVALAIPQIEALVEHLTPRMRQGGRLFYIGAGTSGRLGILDASEIPPTYGAPYDWVIGLIAGGDGAIRRAVEGAEDDSAQAWNDLGAWGVGPQDTVLGLSASGTTPYVLGGLSDCRSHGVATACIVCNPGAPILEVSDYPILIVTGPEFVTGSTRMKA